MKKIITILCLVVICFYHINPVLASLNTHSIDLELSSSQYLSIPDASQTGLDLATDFTFEVGMKLEQLPSTAGTFFSVINKHDATLDKAYLAFIKPADDLFCLAFFDSSANYTQFNMNEAFVAGDVGNWIHLTVTVDISVPSMSFYKNSISKAGTQAIANATTIKNNDEPFMIGSRLDNSSAGAFFDGLIDEVRVWSDIRTPTEISDNYDKELVGNEANLVGYWKLNNSLLDETANNNDLTNNNSAVFSSSVPFVGAERRIIITQ